MKGNLPEPSPHEHRSIQPAIRMIVRSVVVSLLALSLLVTSSPSLDSKFGLPRLNLDPYTIPVALLFIEVGWPIAFWALSKHLSISQSAAAPGTPPYLLITDGPYKYCRNPVLFGTLLGYLGVAVWMESLAAVGLVLLAFALLIPYVRLVTERNMEAHFGPKYAAYKRRTSFLIPGLHQHR